MIEGQTSAGKASGSGRSTAWPRSLGIIMAAKKKAAPRKKAETFEPVHPAFAVLRTATRSVVNMAIVSAACGTTLLTLMAALKFQLA